jgi:hypothetical protein
MGMDEQGRIYIGFTSHRSDNREDFLVFRYNRHDVAREYLGSFMEIASAVGNLGPGEEFPKGHTRMIFADSQMYMGSQGFHDFKREITALPNYRGGHIFAYDTRSGVWDDLAAEQVGGVLIRHEGIVALNVLPGENLLVGLTHPLSNILLYDYKTRVIDRVVPGIPWALGNPLSREVVVAPNGNIYTLRGTEDPADRDAVNSVWVYNIHNGEMKKTDFTVTNGFWIGQTKADDGRMVYLSTVNGRLYAFDTLSEKFSDLGNLFSGMRIGQQTAYLYAITLSPDERFIYFIPTFFGDPKSNTGLYAYEISSGTIEFVEDLPCCVYTSGDLRDEKAIYFAGFGSFDNFWSGNARLIAIDVQQN